MVETVSRPLQMSSSHEPVAAVAGQVRRRVRALLTRWGVRAETVDDALMVVEEFVANVVDHARTPFRLVIRLIGDELHIGVSDRSTRSPLLQPFDPHAVRGRGLQLVSTLAVRWGCTYHADGKTVWAELSAARC